MSALCVKNQYVNARVTGSSASKCFTCNGFGHWATTACQCPSKKVSVCGYCGERGHAVADCAAKNARMVEKECMDVTDIFYNVSIACDKAMFARMKTAVDELVKRNCGDRYGYVDEYKLAELMFESGFSAAYSVWDVGHLKLIGYLIGKYLSAGNDILKEFLGRLREDYEEEVGPMEWEEVVNKLCNLVVVRRVNKSGTVRESISYRKRTGTAATP